MLIELRELKSYLRIDSDSEDEYITRLSGDSEQFCRDIARIPAETELNEHEERIMRTAVLYAAAYLYEHREEADHHALTLSLRALLNSVRRGEFV